MNTVPDNTQATMAELAPVLDEAINGLRAKDRSAILLRFFEQRDLRGIGNALGISENAAQKRVSRALNQLRALLQARGVTLSATALGGLLTAEAVSAAPASVAVAVSTSALVATTGAAAATASVMKVMIMTKLKTSIVGAIAVAGLTTTLLIQNQAQARLQRGEQELQSDLLDALRANRTNLAVLETTPAQHSANNLDELRRLRGEVASLRQRTNELAILRATASGSRRNLPKQKTALEEREDYTEQAFSKMNSSRGWMIAFHLWADQNNGQFPASFDQALPLLDDEAKNEPTLNQFDIVYHGSLSSLSNNASKIIVLREKQPWFAESKWAKAYAFADGHSEIHSSSDGNFDEWEKQHMVVPAADQ